MTNETTKGIDSPTMIESNAAADNALPQNPSLISRWLQHHNAPYVFGAGILAAAALFALAPKMNVPLPSLGGGPDIVVFDPVKFVNAQRAAASLLVMSPNADLTLTMTQVAKQAEAVIHEEAGGAIVLVKQAVVTPDSLIDITDNVLTRFGLPTDVPTVTMKPETLESIAPTDNAFSAGKLREDYQLELKERSQRIAEEQQKKDRQASVLP